MATALKVSNVSKQYRLGQIGTGTLSHDLKRFWYRFRGLEDPFMKVGDENVRSSSEKSEYVWALRDINFEIEEGDVVGIIGKNGAGKSTLLKMLSRITGPTTGEIKIRGRVATLLEVGTGFHPELTGKENIFLNGAILGMRKHEIKLRLEEIVEFSGCRKYIDTPVKRYSSGMIVRLGFAVAAHLDPEILIVDEVLAVGDIEFQDKCLGKMKDISGQGRTILFVSHNMASVKALCKHGILMENGRISAQGSMTEIVEKYLISSLKSSEDGSIPDKASTINTGVAKFRSIKVLDTLGRNVRKIGYHADIHVQLSLFCEKDLRDALLDVRISTRDGVELVHCMNKYSSEGPFPLKRGNNTISCKIQNQLQPGNYSITIGVHETTGLTLDFVENIFDLTVMNIGEGEHAGFTYDFRLAHVFFRSEWKIISE